MKMAVKKKQDLRKEIISNYCSQRKILEEKSSQNFVTLVTNPLGTIGYCHVPKVASSGWMTVFAKANNVQETLKHSDPEGRQNYSHFSAIVFQIYLLFSSQDDLDLLLQRGELHKLMLANFSLELNVKLLPLLPQVNIFKFIFIRHPFERLGRYVPIPMELFASPEKNNLCLLSLFL